MYLTIACIAKNEPPQDLEEFINHHRAVGVEHIYIYDNESAIPIRLTHAKYIEAGHITVIDWPGRGKQMPAYTDALKRFGTTSRWMAWVDSDEFLNPKEPHTSVPEVLQWYEAFAGLAVSWVLFGSGGLIQRPPGLLTELFTSATQLDHYENTHCKVIVQPARTLMAGSNPHYAIYKPGDNNVAVSTDYQIVPNAWNKNITDTLQLNHYFLKTRQDFEKKILKGRADVADPKIPGRRIEDFDYFDSLYDHQDTTIQRFISTTKKLYL